jgi:hypothetical protein
MKEWIGSPPQDCDICGATIGQVFFDAKVHICGNPIWGLVCNICFESYGGRLGLGLGQKFELSKDGHYRKVEG